MATWERSPCECRYEGSGTPPGAGYPGCDRRLPETHPEISPEVEQTGWPAGLLDLHPAIHFVDRSRNFPTFSKVRDATTGKDVIPWRGPCSNRTLKPCLPQ